MNAAARTTRRAARASALRAMLAHHAEQIERQAAREGRAVGFWDVIPGIPRATVEGRRVELWVIEANPHGLSQSEREWITVEDAVFGARRSA